MHLCLRIFLVTLLACNLSLSNLILFRADLNFIHYAGELGGGTDIIPGEFEGKFAICIVLCLGGHRIWQGSLDLLRYIEEMNPQVNESTIVVELGCGHGLPGTYMLRKGACVYFQDLNEDSLSKATLPTIVTNCGSNAINRYHPYMSLK